MVDLLFDHEQHCIDYDYEHRCAEHEHDILSLWLLLGAFLKPPAPQVVAHSVWAHSNGCSRFKALFQDVRVCNP